MQQKRWIDAAEFLWKPEESWPTEKLLDTQFLLQDDPALKKNLAVFTTINTETPTDHLLSYFSDLTRLRRAVCSATSVPNVVLQENWNLMRHGLLVNHVWRN